MIVAICDREVMSHPVVTFYTTEKVSTIVHVLKTEQHDGFPVVQKDDENVCIPFCEYFIASYVIMLHKYIYMVS